MTPTDSDLTLARQIAGLVEGYVDRDGELQSPDLCFAEVAALIAQVRQERDVVTAAVIAAGLRLAGGGVMAEGSWDASSRKFDHIGDRLIRPKDWDAFIKAIRAAAAPTTEGADNAGT